MDTKEKYKGRGKFSARAKKRRQSDMLRKAAKHTQERQEQEARKSKAPAVHYDQPTPFNRKRLVMQLGLVAAVVVAILLGVSVFFKVDTVVVYGNSKYEAWTIREASGIQEGENLLTLGTARACDRIMDQLPYVEKARIGVNLPGTVNIYVTEYEVAYSLEAEDGSWWLISSDGRIVGQTDAGGAKAYTRIVGVRLSDPVEGEQAVAAEGDPETITNAAGEEIEVPVITTGTDRLEAAMTVMASLEHCDVLGEVASIDVSQTGDMSLWYGTRFQVLLGGTKNMDKKIAWMADTISQLEEYQSGVLDVTFTTRPDQAIYTPFE